MRRSLSRFMVLALALGALMLACAPAAPNPAAEVAGARAVPAVPNQESPEEAPAQPAQADAAALAEAQALRQQTIEVHRGMLQVLAHLLRLDAQGQWQVSVMLVDLMADTSQFMVSMQPAMDLMTPDERRAADANLKRTQQDLLGISQVIASATPGAVPPADPRATPGVGSEGQASPPRMDEMGRQMDDLHRRMRSQLQWMGTDQMQSIAAHMVDIFGNMNRLKDVTGPGLSRINSEQRRVLGERMGRMQALVQEMMHEGSTEAETP